MKKAGKASVISISVSFWSPDTHLAITIFKGHANFHFSFQADWLLKEYLDAMMRLGAVGVGGGCGLGLSQGTGYILAFFTHWA